MFIGSKTNAALETALSGLWQRHRTISHNIANQDLPGYKAKRIDFESYLKKEINHIRRNESDLTPRESISRLRNSTIREYELGGQSVRIDGNNVDIDSEYIEMARAQLQYNAVLQRVNGHYSNLKYVISGGR